MNALGIAQHWFSSPPIHGGPLRSVAPLVVWLVWLGLRNSIFAAEPAKIPFPPVIEDNLRDLVESDPRGTNFYWWLRGKREIGSLLQDFGFSCRAVLETPRLGR